MSADYDEERGYPKQTHKPVPDSHGDDGLRTDAWIPFPPPMYVEDWLWVWLRDAKDYREPTVVQLSCNQAYRIGVYFNELDDLPVDWATAEVKLISTAP